MKANNAVENLLEEKLSELEAMLSADVMVYAGGIVDEADLLFRDACETREKRRSKLAILLQTAGGYIEVAERIVTVTRKHYGEVDFYIPDSAMSAGTVLVMSGDAIHMDYFSLLGPIDPQIQRPSDGKMIPALGYLAQYESLIEKDRQGLLTTAEAHILLKCFDQGELHSFEQARELSVTLLKQWLAKYKFKNWSVTATQGTPVTPTMREDRAGEIARKLNDTTLWHSHSRGISMEVARKELNLLIEDFESKPDLHNAIRTYYKLLKDYMAKRGHAHVLHASGRYASLWED